MGYLSNIELNTEGHDYTMFKFTFSPLLINDLDILGIEMHYKGLNHRSVRDE